MTNLIGELVNWQIGEYNIIDKSIMLYIFAKLLNIMLILLWTKKKRDVIISLA